MNYSQFSSQPNLLKRLLLCLGILTTNRLIIKIENTPDHDISKYEREIDTNYFFHSSWNFSSVISSVLNVNFLETKLYHFEELERARDEFHLTFDYSNPAALLNEVYQLDRDWFSDNGMDPDMDQFKLHDLRLRSIDNSNKQFFYEGSFFGNHETYDQIDWGIYSLIQVVGMPEAATKFYRDLIGESYLLYNEDKYKLSYFLAYSAFESFVNLEHGSADVEQRLKDKLTELYRMKFTALERHQIYTSVISFYDEFTNNRNIIAHGRNDLIISTEGTRTALLFILTMIAAFNLNCTTFKDLYEQLPKMNSQT